MTIRLDAFERTTAVFASVMLTALFVAASAVNISVA